jgi:hypothetical protein
MGTVLEMQECLKKVMEYLLREIEADITHGTISQRSTLYLIINTIPCILHLENRVGLKCFTRLLRIGLDNVKEGILGMDGGENVRIEAYLELIQYLCNTSIWASKEQVVCWMCPYDTQMKKITTICLDNVQTWKVINSLDLLVDVSIPEGDGRDLWKKVTSGNQRCRTLS